MNIRKLTVTTAAIAILFTGIPEMASAGTVTQPSTSSVVTTFKKIALWQVDQVDYFLAFSTFPHNPYVLNPDLTVKVTKILCQIHCQLYGEINTAPTPVATTQPVKF